MGKKSHNKALKADQQEKETSKGKKKPKRDGRPRPQEHLEQIPYRLREIMKSKEKMKMGAKKLRKNVRAARDSSMEISEQEEIPVPHFRRGKLESERSYLQRMERETQHVLFLTKNQPDRRPELAVDQGEAESCKHKSEKKKLFDKGRLQRLHLKKAQREEDRAEKQMFVDDVQFGEVAMEPPSLTTKPRKAPVKSQAAPKDLLLTSLCGQTVASTAKPSIAKQRILEEERERVVQAYRQLKKQKQEAQERQKSKIRKPQNVQ